MKLMFRKKKIFTLLELIISITIIAILVVLLFKVFKQISDISIRVENEKIINNESLFILQTIQNIADKNNIDYSKYTGALAENYGITSKLYLTGNDSTSTISIYSTGECTDNISEIKNNNCWIQMKRNNQILDLTNKNKTYFRKFYFKIIPFTGNFDKYDTIYQNGFFLFSELYIKNYSSGSRRTNVKTNYELFFNIRKY